MTIISLTSIPPRFQVLKPTLNSLVQQGADAVILALPKRYRSHLFDGGLPDVPDGVTILRTEEDFGPATKLLASVQRHPTQRILYCDDDVIYAPGWLRAFEAAAPDAVICAGSAWSVSRIGRQGAADGYDIVQGFAGVLVPPGLLDAKAFAVPDMAFDVDDIWLSGHYARHRLPIRPVPEARALCQPRNLGAGLQDGPRDRLNRDCAALLHARYGIWPQFSEQ
jgi:hypothetical protein